MPINKINTGAAADDGTGDTLRDAFQKVNLNLDALAAALVPRLLTQWAFAPLNHEHAGAVARFVNNAPPTEPPPVFGAMWVDAEANRIYLATGTADVSDWREVSFAEKPRGGRGKP
jgi:hypothetical protein